MQGGNTGLPVFTCYSGVVTISPLINHKIVKIKIVEIQNS